MRVGRIENINAGDSMEWFVQRFELSRGGGAHNVRPMEGVRGFAVFLVFLVHYVTLVKPWFASNAQLLRLTDAVHTVGNAGVDLFFVLSGFLIYGSLISRQQPFARFLSRRVLRIYPAFIAVFAAYLLLSFVFPAESKIPTNLTGGVVYLIQNVLLLPGLFPVEPMITVAWSLSYEMFYYLTIPVLVASFGLRGRSVLWRVNLFVMMAAAFAIYCSVYGGHVRLIMFVSGILLYEAINGRRCPIPRGSVGLSALVLGLVATLLPVNGASGIAIKAVLLFGAFFLFSLACFDKPSAWLPRVFSWLPLRWLGNMSYSYYLVHGLALKASFLALAIFLPVASYNAWLFWVLLPVMFVCSLVPAATLFLMVERPLSLAPQRRAALGSVCA
jgi:peptidoglycan/LPS O-acetylase OafA/YrhL